MMPSLFQVPPAETSGSVAITRTEPLATSRIFKFACARNARARPSGDQKGFAAPSVPGSARVSPVSTPYSQTVRPPPLPSAVHAINRPSREIAMPGAGSPAGAPGVADASIANVAESRAQAGALSPRRSFCVASAAMATEAATAAALAAIHHTAWRDRAGRIVSSCAGSGPTMDNSSGTSPISRSRRFGSLSRQRRRRRTMCGGVAGGSAVQSGSRSRIWKGSPSNFSRRVSFKMNRRRRASSYSSNARNGS